MNTLKLTIHGQPVTKKNSQQIAFNRATGRRFIRQSASYNKFEKSALDEISRLPLDDITPIGDPVNIGCVYYRADRRKCDLVNLLEATLDILVKAGVIGDDNYTIVESHDNCRVLYDKADPRTEITITWRER